MAAALRDYRCPNGHLFEAFREFQECDAAQCPHCEETGVLTYLPRTQFRTAFDNSEVTVLWMTPQGEVNYPGRNDVPIPERLQAQGFERVELRSLRAVEQFESKHGVRNERAWFDKGSGRSFDNDGRDPKMER